MLLNNMIGPKTSLFIQIVAAACVGGAVGFYIQHKVWSVEKVRIYFILLSLSYTAKNEEPVLG